MNPLPFVVVGESLVDVVVSTDGQISHAVGGSPMNVAVGLARLDVPVLLITRLGDDEHGRWISEHVRSSGVQLSDSSVVPGSKTSTATARLDEDNSAAYEFDLVWDLEHHQLPETVALHVGSLGASLLPGRHAVLDLVRQAEQDDIFVSYDPNIRSALVDDTARAWDELVEVAARSRLVKASEEDFHILRPGESVEDLAKGLLSGTDTELVIVTRGAQGSLAFAEGLRVEAPAPRTDVVDTVGAGDSFMAAALAILDDWDLPKDGPGSLSALDADHVRVLLHGAMSAAALTCSRRGANPPTRLELPTTWPV
ncbi:MAG: carbohydrate kinase family protein [Nocardioidaceae bacterium]